MAIDGHHIVVGVFDESTLADMALEHLQNAGFHSSQIYCSDPGKKPDAESGRGVRGPLMEYWPGSKDLFTPDPSAAHDALAQQLRALGLSDGEIRHYKSQHDMRCTIIAVNAPGREEEANVILRANGGHN